MMNKKGITLITLIITIIILIIVAGISITNLVTDNALISKANNASTLHEIAELEEIANTEYINLIKETGLGHFDKISLPDIAKKLIEKGYQIERLLSSKEAITGIKLDKSSLSLNTNNTSTIKVTYEGNDNNSDFYAIINNKYHKLSFDNSEVKIATKTTDVSNLGIYKDITVSITSGNSIQIKEINQNTITVQSQDITGLSTIKVSYEDFSKDCDVTVVLKPTTEETIPKLELDTDYGMVDIIWLSGTTNNYSSTPNEPYLYTHLEESKQLKPVTWTYHEDGIQVGTETVNWVEDATAKTTWYNYSADKGNDGKEDNTTSMWANAKNSDGSYFVWIPRYAYRITYYADPSHTQVIGYYDGNGMWRAEDGKVKYKLDEGIETVSYNGLDYIVHPAFVNDTSKYDADGNVLEDYARGGWDKNQTGIWIAKYEMSREGATKTDEKSTKGTSVPFYSIPNVISAHKIAIGNMYAVALTHDSAKQSHLIKASEWGAAAYLTQSKYGRNCHEITQNTNANAVTGYGGSATSNYSYNTTQGAKASTTGNVYGIYDMSGCSWEYVAAFDKFGDKNKVKNNGKTMTQNAKNAAGYSISTKYATSYENGTTLNRDTEQLYITGKVGDATKEVRMFSAATNWNDDNSTYMAYGVPFLGRGGGNSPGNYSGIYYSDSTNGGGFPGVSFRIALGQ